jgi:hypothetical protein
MSTVDLIVKGVALLIAIGLLLSSIDFSYFLTKFFVRVKDDSDEVADDNFPANTDGVVFLKTLELWYLLKKKCDESKLDLASKKMDEVFPLLNNNLETNP